MNSIYAMNNIFRPVVERYRSLQTSVPPMYLGNPDPQMLLIDMGHGALDKSGKYVTPGKRAAHPDFAFYEGVWTRAIGWTLARKMYNSSRNYAVLTYGYKDIPLAMRVLGATQFSNIARMNGKKIYLMSIHGNAFGVESVNGVEIFTSPGDTMSDPIATVYYNELKKLGWKMRPGFGDGDPDKEARFTMLTGPEKYGIPAILPEIGFYTNEKQVREMCLPQTMDKIAEILRNADVRLNELNIFQ